MVVNTIHDGGKSDWTGGAPDRPARANQAWASQANQYLTLTINHNLVDCSALKPSCKQKQCCLHHHLCSSQYRQPMIASYEIACLFAYAVLKSNFLLSPIIDTFLAKCLTLAAKNIQKINLFDYNNHFRLKSKIPHCLWWNKRPQSSFCLQTVCPHT